MKNRKFFWLLLSLVPIILMSCFSIFRTGWPLTAISTLSVLFWVIYTFKNRIRSILEKPINEKNLFVSGIEFLLMLVSLFGTYSMSVIFFIGIADLLDLSLTVVSILCVWMIIPIILSWFRIIKNLIK